jgi:hypothetical protein
MTCCIAALSRDAIVLVSDKMIGSSLIQGEPQGLLKMARIHKDWWALFAGRVDLPGDFTDRFRKAFPPGALSLSNVDAYLSTTMTEKWLSDTERRYLLPEGYDSARFRDEAPKKMTDAVYQEVRDNRNAYDLDAAIVVAGFDGEGTGHILSCYGYDDIDHKKFVPANHDMTGYYAIGTGAATAMWMMSYKDVGPQMKTPAVAFYAVEGKYYAELGQGVGECTDLIVIRHCRPALLYNTRLVDKVFIPIAKKLRPRKLTRKQRRKINRVKTTTSDGW